MITRRAMQHMSSQRRAAALFDGRHDLELPQAQMGLLSLPPRRTVSAKNIRDLQCGTHHDRDLHDESTFDLYLRQAIQRADHFAQKLGRHLRIERGGVQLLVPEQHLDHPDIHLLLQQMGGKGVTKRVH